MPRIPRVFAALIDVLIDALKFPEDAAPAVGKLSDGEWRELLRFADRAQLTLALAERAPSGLPGWVQERLARNISQNAKRLERIAADYAKIAAALRSRGIEHITLKGATHVPDFVSAAQFRQQSDIDLFCPREQVQRAYAAVRELDYAPIEWVETFPADHLPTLVPRNEFVWHGDQFDPEIPIAVELHYRFWDRETERFGPRALDSFWTRRANGRLDPVDTLAYASLHLLRHICRGDSRPFWVYEIATFLERRADDEIFWPRWRNTHDGELRQLQAICFRLATDWFACRLAPEARDEVDRLPAAVARWFDDYSRSPLENGVRPNKHELWLHLGLVDTWRDRTAIARRRLVPSTLPVPRGAAHKRTGSAPAVWLGYAWQLTSRAIHHGRLLLPSLWHGARWLWRYSSPRASRASRATAESRSP